MQIDSDEILARFLKLTHRAWQMVVIPGVTYYEKKNLSEAAFVHVMREGRTGEVLRSFCGQLPLVDGEWLVQFYWHLGTFGAGRGNYVLTTHRLAITDSKSGIYHVIDIRKVSNFEKLKGNNFAVVLGDGSRVEINAAATYAPSLVMLRTVSDWAKNSQDSEAFAAKLEASQPSEVQAANLGSHYGQMYADRFRFYGFVGMLIAYFFGWLKGSAKENELSSGQMPHPKTSTEPTTQQSESASRPGDN